MYVRATFTERRQTLDRIQVFLDLPNAVIPQYSAKVNENPIPLDPPDDATQTALAEFYAPYNERLYELLGRDFGW